MKNCRQCNKKLKPTYEHDCKDCGHAVWFHSFMPDGRCAGAAKTCYCTAPNKIDPVQFKKTLKGHGVADLFCTKKCAVRWAIEHATERKI